jgi:hypothetical protein
MSWADVKPIFRHVATEVILPGTNRAADINAAIARQAAAYDGTVKKEVLLLPGVHELEAPITMMTGVVLRGYGDRTALDVVYTGSGADTSTNALIRIEGANTAQGATTLSSVAPKGDTVLDVTSATGYTEGGYAIIWGNNAGGDGYLCSDGTDIILYEVVKIASISGTALTLASPTIQHHASGVSIRPYTPVRDVAVEDLSLYCDGETSIAVGIHARGVLGLDIRNVSGGGFSRAMIECNHGTRRFNATKLHSRGAVNSIVLMDSAHSGRVLEVTTDPNGDRYHANGIPRGLITCRNRCTGIQIHDCTLERGVVGIRLWGGFHIQVSNVRIRDMDASRAITQDTTEITGGKCGAGIDTGARPTSAPSIAEFGQDWTFSNVTVEDITCTGNIVSWYFHDAYFIKMVDCAIVNRGLSPSTSGMTGMHVSDVYQAEIVNLALVGVSYGIYTENAPYDINFRGVTYNTQAGQGAIAAIFLYLDHSAGAGGSRMRFTDARVINANAMLRFGGSYSTDVTVELRNYYDEALGGTVDFAHIAYNGTGGAFSPGDVVVYDTSSTATRRDLLGASTAAPNCAVVVAGSSGDIGTGNIWVAPLAKGRKAMVKCTTAEVNIGDLLVATTGRRAVADNAANALNVLGVALTYKAAGSEGLVQCG